MKFSETTLMTGLLTVIMSQVCGQETTDVIDLEERKASIVNLEAHVASRFDRMHEMADDIIALDARVEEGIEELVQLLSQVADSPDSKTSVSNTKRQMMEGLKKTIDYYRTKRATVRESLRTGRSDIPTETLENDVQVFDKRIEKRVEQIVQLSSSFTQHEDYEKYVETEESYWGWDSWGGWGNWKGEEINEDWKQDRRDKRKTDMNQEEVAEALAKSIDDLDQRQKYLQEKLRTGHVTETERQLYEADIERIEKIMSGRRAQLVALQEAVQPDTEKLGRDQAYDLSNHLDDASRDLRADFFLIFQKYEELNKLRAQVAAMEENLEARRDWIAEYEAKGGQ
ncbi:MAG: hypothetical protein AAGA96_14675 [Verrucomicrobiota bacterium]